MEFIELFAGIGGFRIGLENCRNILQSKTTENIQETMSCVEKRKAGFTCVYANEWDKYACQIYRKNFGDKRMLNKNPEVYQATTKIRDKKGQLGEQFNKCAKGQYDYSKLHEGDIKEISAESIPDHDLLTAGFPCPSYSIAGKRKGFKDPRGALFFEICRIAKVKKPRLLLLENVKGLLNHEGGATFRTILYSLSELGYDCEWEVINSAYFTVPQNRERVFIIGHLRGTGGPKVFPIGEGNQVYSECETKERQRRSVRPDPAMSELTSRWREAKNLITEKEQAKSLTASCYKGAGSDGMTLIRLDEKSEGRDREIKRIYDPQGLAPTLHLKTGGWQEPKIKVMNTLTEALGTRQGSSKEYIKSVKNIYEAIGLIRRLTPTECERLQGFPDGWTEGISDTQRYKCLGNAVTVNVIKEIGKRIAKVQQEIF